MSLLGGSQVKADPHFYFSESSKVLNVGTTSFDFMSVSLQSVGFRTPSQLTTSDGENWGDKFCDIEGGSFTDAQVGDIIRVNGYGDRVKFCESHTYNAFVPSNDIEVGNDYIQFTISDNNVLNTIKQGLSILYYAGNHEGQSYNYNISSVYLVPPSVSTDPSNFNWTATACGDINITGGTTGQSGNVYTLNPNNSNNTTLTFTGGGAIVITAEGKQNTAVHGYRAYYVITVPYEGETVWDFYSGVTPFESSSIANSSQNGLWKDDWKSKPSSGSQNYQHHIYVAKPDETARDGNSRIYGTNAFYIPETAGLLFDVNSGGLGYNDNTLKLVTFGGGEYSDSYTPRFMIPQVKGGSYITIWWNAMSEGKLGARLSVSNVYDLEGVKVDTPFGITGVTEYDKCEGATIFKVEGNADSRYDIVVSLYPVYHDGKWQTGWNDLYRIKIADNYDTDMVLFECQDNSNGWNVGGVVEYNNSYGSIVQKKGQKAERYYNGTAAKSILHRGFSCDFEATGEGGVTFDQEVLVNSSGHKYLHLTNIEGTGNIKITQKEYFVGDNNKSYVLSKKETWLAVGEYTEQSYPYTWDFTDYNVGRETLAGNLSRSPQHKYGYWDLIDASDQRHGLETHDLVDASKVNNNNVSNYVWNNVKIEKPLFAQGSQLVYGKANGGVGVIKETEGLRVKQRSASGLGVGEEFDQELSINGYYLKFAPTPKSDHGLIITIPSIPQGGGKDNMWVFIKANAQPTGVWAATDKDVSPKLDPDTPELCSLQDNVWAYEVTSAGDVEIYYTKDVEIQAIGVTNIFKSINLLGYATESRDVSIDHSYEGFFTKDDVNAYCILADDFGSPYNYKGTPIVVKSDESVNVVPDNTGIVLYKSGHNEENGGFNVPLFYPACNLTVKESEQNLYDVNMMAPNVARTEHKYETETVDGVEYTKFVMSRQYYVYHKSGNTGTDSEEKTSEQEAFYRMRVNSGVNGTSNWMEANKAYLRIPTGQLPLALWNNGNGKGTPGYAKPGVIFMDDIEALFGGEEPFSGIATAIDAIESTETVGNNNTFHTLSGMQIQGVPTQKGVYIVNGKKVLVK